MYSVKSNEPQVSISLVFGLGKQTNAHESALRHTAVSFGPGRCIVTSVATFKVYTALESAQKCSQKFLIMGYFLTENDLTDIVHSMLISHNLTKKKKKTTDR